MAAVLLAIVIAPLPLTFTNAARGLFLPTSLRRSLAEARLPVQGTAGSAF
jgi:hypothetical protein